MKYKCIQYSLYPDYDALMVEDYGEYDAEQVLRSTTLVELAGHIKPINLIIDRRRAEKLPDYFVDFLEEHIFLELRDYGVKRIFYVIPPEELQTAIDYYLIPPYVTLCGTLSDVFQILDKEKEI
ncbi:MAG: hypothetical protein ACXWCZ_11515 [Flavisolibacter sp.]